MFTAWHLRLRQYYPGQEVINEHNDPNLAETPHYKEKQTILPNPICADIHDGKKPHTPLKRTHDGKVKKDKKDLLKSPMIDEQSSPKEVCIKSEEAKIDMRKLVIEHKTPHKKSSSSTGSNGMSSTKKHSSSSTTSSHKEKKDKNKDKDKDKEKNKEKDKHKSSGSSDSHRSHSSKKSHSDKHRRDDNRKSSSASNHSSSSEKKLSNESSSKKESLPKSSSSQSVPKETKPTVQSDKLDNSKIDEIKTGSSETLSPVQVSSSHSNTPATSVPQTPASPSPVSSPAHAMATPIESTNESPSFPEEPQPTPPPFDILPPLPKDDMPQIPPPPPPPPINEEQSMNKSNIMPDSSTQQSPTPNKVRKLNNGDKAATKTDLLGSIMASMESPRNTSSF